MLQKLKDMINIEKKISKKINSYIFYIPKNKFELIIKKYLRNNLIKKYGVTVGLKTRAASSILFPHPKNITLGEEVIIGEKCVIYQNVTIGKKQLFEEGYPHIGDNVIIYSGAVIIGNITIGNNVTIGANSVVTMSVPSNSIVGGVPGKIIKIRSKNE